MTLTTLLVLVGGIVGACVLGTLVLFVRPSVLYALAVGASVLSGNSDRIGMPISPDRILMVAALFSLVLGFFRPDPPPGLRVVRPVEVLMLVVLVVGTASALAAGTLFQTDSAFGLIDRLGLVPFLGFALADRLYGTERDRRVLIAVLTGVGAYLSLTAFFEIAGPSALVIPSYINNSLIGSHWGRARGPFLEAGANGLALFMCGACAAVGGRIFRARTLRVLALTTAALCALGVLLTLTRADWIGAVAGAVVGCLLDPRARRRLVPVMIGAAILVLGALIVVPGLADRASDRTADQRPIWDRQNTDTTALRMFETNPVFGVGWHEFIDRNADYARQADGYPLSRTLIGVHNVTLSYAAELGLVGLVPWLATVVLALLAAWKGSAQLAPEWRALAFAVFVDWLVVSSFSPLAYAFPNICLWLLLGIAAAPTARRLVGQRTQPTPARLTASA